ncbi:MAG TPA: hypothetical protein VFU20_06055 [Sphingomicrobium sp.]|nr:hypothetical protein [Sphingomicrobium sp.]
MRIMVLGFAAPLAAVALPAAPAVALDPASPQFTVGAAAGVTVHRGQPGRFDRGFRRDGDRDDRRRHRGGDDFVFIYDRDWQGDTAWRANSYNDWWHERPWRAYPRWVRSNQDCERVWQGGGTWRCEW